MTLRIKLLPDHISKQIAAGEVIQRPSSVVKELLENAIDAGPKNIQLIIKNAGKTLIQVNDDGSGIMRKDLSLAFQRHLLLQTFLILVLCQVWIQAFFGKQS